MTGRSIALIALMATLVASLLYVRSRFLVVELSYLFMQAQEIKTDLEQQKRSLIVELATLRTPARIEKLAQTHLHLNRIEPSASTIVIKKEEKP